MVRGVVSVNLGVGAAVQQAPVVHGVVGRTEGIGVVEINNATVAVVRVVQIGDAIVVVVPVNAVLQTVAVHVGVQIVGPVVTVQRTVDDVEVVVVVQVAVPVDVQCVHDAVVVIVNVVPVADPITVPVVELGIGCTTGLAARIRIDRVGVGLRGAVPRGHISSTVKREGVVLVLDVVVVKVVGKVSTAHGEVAEVVRRGGATHVSVKPVVDAVVVLVKRSAHVIVKVAVVIQFTIDDAVVVAVATGDFEVQGVHAGDRDGGVGISGGDGHRVT